MASDKIKDESSCLARTEQQKKGLEFVDGRIDPDILFEQLRVDCESGLLTKELMREHRFLYSSLDGKITCIENSPESSEAETPEDKY